MENIDQNPIVPSPNDQPAAPQIPAPPGKRNLVIGSIALVGLLIGVGAAAYFFYPPSPEKVAQRMTKMLAAANSMEFNLKMDMDMQMNLQDMPEFGQNRQIKISTEFDGATDSSDPNNVKFYGLMKVAGEGLVFSADLRGIGKVYYLKLNEAPFLGFIDPGKIKNQWIRIDSQEINQELGLPEQGTSLSEADEKLIEDLYENSKILKLETRLGSEQINDLATNHYRFSIDKQELKTFFGRVMEITNKQLTKEEKAEFEKVFDQFEFEPGEVWVGRKDNLPYKVVMTMNIKGTPEVPTSGKLVFSGHAKSYNRPVNVEAPSNSKNFKELFGDLFGPLGQPELPPFPVN